MKFWSITVFFERGARELTSKKANCFIFSLALSDLCSGLVSPIGIYIKTWGFNPFYWPSAFCNVSTKIFTDVNSQDGAP